jgi:superfamily I DNA and/or RNA helicase
MLNLVYAKTRDERVYEVLSQRLKDKFDLFGALPDIIDDEWIDHVEALGEEIDKYIEKRAAAKNMFELRYQGDEVLDSRKDRWELCERVLARQELVEKLSEGW